MAATKITQLFQKIYILIILLVSVTIIFPLFTHIGLWMAGKTEESVEEGLVTHGSCSVPDARTAIVDILNSNNSSIVQVSNIKNIMLDTKFGTNENLSANDAAFFDSNKQILTIIDDTTLSSDAQLNQIHDIMKNAGWVNTNSTGIPGKP